MLIKCLLQCKHNGANEKCQVGTGAFNAGLQSELSSLSTCCPASLASKLWQKRSSSQQTPPSVSFLASGLRLSFIAAKNPDRVETTLHGAVQGCRLLFCLFSQRSLPVLQRYCKPFVCPFSFQRLLPIQATGGSQVMLKSAMSALMPMASTIPDETWEPWNKVGYLTCCISPVFGNCETSALSKKMPFVPGPRL